MKHPGNGLVGAIQAQSEGVISQIIAAKCHIGRAGDGIRDSQGEISIPAQVQRAKGVARHIELVGTSQEAQCPSADRDRGRVDNGTRYQSQASIKGACDTARECEGGGVGISDITV